ncbi:MAG: amidohydrolase family protein [Chloroflexi bacterium]|nr:amidohydrolase family protein [Chloroflexota bacterium]
MRLALTNCNVIDCITPEPKPGAGVVIEDGRIVEILGPGESAGPTDQVIDLAGAYLLPGLWDVHIHPEHPFPPGTTMSQQTALFGQNLSRGLTQAGVTGVRCGGAADFMDVAWKRAFSVPGAAGPRVFACGNFLTTTGGHFLTSGLARECDGPYGFAQAIRDQMKNDVDHIKLNLSGGIMGPRWDRHTDSFLLPEELETAFALCHQRSFKVMAHATNPQAVKAAVRLGAHSVEHGYIMDEETIGMLLDNGTWYVPTLSITHLTPSQATSEWEKEYAERKNLAPDLVVRAEAASQEHRQWFQQALAAGVKMALGSDINPIADSALLEMGLWVKAGATPWQTLAAATRNAAELCGVGGELGTVEEGKLADLIVVADNPLADIQNLRRLLLVFKDGKVVADHR